MPLSREELKDVENFLVDLLESTIGPIVKESAGTLFEQFDDKANQVDLVTVVDKKVESIIKEKLTEQYPSFKFIGEESFVKGETQITDEPTFIVDPIDGTTNFIHGYPYSCTSLGLAEFGIPVVGAVFNPHLGQLFHASKGNGAYLNGKRIKVPHRPLSLQKSLIGLEAGSERDEASGNGATNFDRKMVLYKRLMSAQGAYAHGFRSLGSGAMNICYVAAGMMDCFWEGGCWAWDVCAGACILRESGGVFVGGNPGRWEIPLTERCYFAIRGGSTSEEQREYIKEFWSYVPSPLEY